MRRLIAAIAGAVLAGVVVVTLGSVFLRTPHHVVEAATEGGPYEDILPAFRPPLPDEFFFSLQNNNAITVTGFITVYTGTTISLANRVGALPVALAPLTTTVIAIASVPGVPVGHEGFAQVLVEWPVNSNAYSSQGRYHIVNVGDSSFGPPPVAAAEGAHAGHAMPAGTGPYETFVQPGDTVSWVVSRWSGFTHNIQEDDGAFTNGAPNSSWRIFSHTFTYSGDFPYFCGVHGEPGGVGMAGIIHVGGNVPSPTPTTPSGNPTATFTATSTPTVTPTGTLTPTPTPTNTAQPSPNAPRQGTEVFLPMIGRENE